MAVTHAAGPAVNVGGRVIQRCAVCGLKLLDSKNTAGPVGPNGEPPEFPLWAEAALVEIDGNRQSLTGTFGEDPTPADFCIDLVEWP